MNFTPCLLKIQITILFCAEFFTQSKIRNTKYMRFSWGNCIILLLCYRTCQKHTKSFKTEKSRRNSPIMQYYSYHLITSCSQNLIFNIFCYLIMQLRANIHFSVTASALSPSRHCERVYERGNPLHGASTATTPSSCLRLLRRYAPRNDIVVSLPPNRLIITCPLKIVRKCTKCKYYASPCLNMAFSYKTDKFSVGAKIGHSEFSY